MAQQTLISFGSMKRDRLDLTFLRVIETGHVLLDAGHVDDFFARMMLKRCKDEEGWLPCLSQGLIQCFIPCLKTNIRPCKYWYDEHFYRPLMLGQPLIYIPSLKLITLDEVFWMGCFIFSGGELFVAGSFFNVE